MPVLSIIPANGADLTAYVRLVVNSRVFSSSWNSCAAEESGAGHASLNREQGELRPGQPNVG